MENYTVLYVDDEPDLLILGKAFLEATGPYTIETRTSAPEGIEALRTRPFDAIISDYLMPEMDGLAFLRAVRQEFGALPFILFTGRGREDVVIEAINLGVDFYLQKGGDTRAQFAELAHKINMAVLRKRAVDEQVASEKRLSSIFHASPIHQLITEYRTGRIIDINDRFLTDLKRTRDDVVGRTLDVIGFVIDPVQLAAAQKQLELGETVRNVEMLVKTGDGRSFTTLTSMTRVRVHDQDLVYTQSVDISAQTKARQTIDALLNAPPDVQMLLDPDGRIMAANHAASERYAVPLPDLTGADAYTLTSPEYAPERRKAIGRVIAKRRPVAYADTINGRIFENHLYPILDSLNEVTAIAVYSHDATEEIGARQALKESEEKYRLLVEHSHDAVYIYRGSEVLFINRQAELITGYTHEELMGMNIWDLVHPDDRERLKASAAKRLSGEQVSSAFYARIVTRDGTVRDGEFYVDLVRFQGKPSILGIFRDITEKKKAQDELAAAYEQLAASKEELQAQFEALKEGQALLLESENKYRTLVEHTEDGVFVAQDGDLLFVNDMLAQRLGYTAHELVGRPFARLIAPEDRDMVVSRHESRLAGSTLPEDYEFTLVHKDGITWSRVRIRVGTGLYQGKPAVIGTLHDVTEERKREAALQQSEELHRKMVDTIPDLIVMCDLEGRITFVNDNVVRLAGEDREEILGRSIFTFIAPAYIDLARKNTALMFERSLGPIEYVFVKKDGDRITLEVNGAVLRRPDQAPYGLIYICRDVTERIQAREALRESEELHRSLITASPDGIAMLDLNGTLTYASPRALEMFSLTDKSEAIGTSVMQWILPSDHGIAQSRFHEVLIKQSLVNNIYRMVKKDGTVFDVEMHSALLHDRNGAVRGIISIMRDITERRQAEKALRESEENYRRLITRTFEAFVFYQEGTIVLANYAAARIAGYQTGDDIIGKPIMEFIHPDSRPLVVQRQKQMLETPGGVVPLIPEKFVQADGTPVDVEVMASTTRYEGRLAVQVIFRDITERQRAQTALRESEENYRRIIENMQDVFYRTDRDGVLTMISTFGARLMGFGSAEEVIGRYRADEFYAFPRERREMLSILMREKSITCYPLTLMDRHGRHHQATASSRVLVDKDGNFCGVEGILHDVTALKETETALLQANRQITLMTSITRHDIHNQLLALNGWLELSRASLGNREKTGELIAKAQDIAGIISQQINFTTFFENMGITPPSWQDPVPLIEKSRRSLPFGSVPPVNDLPAIELYADPLLEKVFYNLLDNSLHYGGKTLTGIRVSSVNRGSSLVLIIEDDGIGIEDKYKRRIFERGFGQNTGLGLFLVREVLSITGLSISETGKFREGARFEIEVPENKYRNNPGTRK